MMSMASTTYIAFLRAINVGGRTVKMEKLRAHFAELGFDNVRTFIQSGNVFFDSKATDREALTLKIERHLKESLGFEVPTMLRTVEQVEHALSLDPFEGVEVTDEVRLCIAFLSAPLPETANFPLVSPKGEMELLSATDGELFVVSHHKPGKVPNAAAFIEKTYKVKTTVRFWNTTQRLLEAAKG
jgi:uncharacterized protein (DUF1697 family)